MKALLLAGALLLAAGASPVSSATSFHVGGNLASGSDPVLIAQNEEFSITRISGGASISAPLTVYFAVPVISGLLGDAHIAYQHFNLGPVIPAVLDITSFVGQWDTSAVGAAKDLYSFVGCTACDNSLNVANLTGEEHILFGKLVTAFNVFSVTVDQGFPNKNDVETFTGGFSFGTVIAPLAVSGDKVFDTSWTNTGVVAASSVPEPSTWLMGLTGFAFIATLGWRRKRCVSA